MGMGRNSSRIASKRLRGQGAVGDGEFNDDNDVDYDWFEYEKKSKNFFLFSSWSFLVILILKSNWLPVQIILKESKVEFFLILIFFYQLFKM